MPQHNSENHIRLTCCRFLHTLGRKCDVQFLTGCPVVWTDRQAVNLWPTGYQNFSNGQITILIFILHGVTPLACTWSSAKNNYRGCSCKQTPLGCEKGVCYCSFTAAYKNGSKNWPLEMQGLCLFIGACPTTNKH